LRTGWFVVLLPKDTFDGVPISIFFMLESASVTVAGGLQPWCAIDEKGRIVGEMFLAEFEK